MRDIQCVSIIVVEKVVIRRQCCSMSKIIKRQTMTGSDWNQIRKVHDGLANAGISKIF